MRIKYILLIVLLGLLLLPWSHPAAWAETATLSWAPPTTKIDGSPLMDLSGFRVYYGTHSDRYTEVIDVGLTDTPSDPAYTIADLSDGNTYYFSVTAYDSTGNESGFSEEASKSFGTSGSGSGGGGGSSIGGGCGMIKDISGGPGQGMGQVVLNLLIPVLLLIMQKLYYQARKRYVLSGIMVSLVRSKMYRGRVVNYVIMLTAMILLLASGPALAANYPLEIIQPRAGLDTKNRFYKAYPGLEYNVHLAVIGGAYPFSYSLTTGPSGMLINSSTGMITWPNPTTTGSPYSVTARVTDQEGSTTSVSWTITVTTSGFIFVDAVNGHASAANGGTGTGTLANPYKTINDWYAGTTGTGSGTKADATFSNYFVYYRSGTYNLNTFKEGDYGGQVPAYGRVPCTGYLKPMVHMAYPGESPVWDYALGGSFIWYGGTSNLYIDGFEIKNMNYYGIQVEMGGSSITIRRNIIHNLSGGDNSNNNQSFIRHLVGNSRSNYMVVQDNIMYDGNHMAADKIYETDRLLVEGNLIYNIADTSGQGGIEGIAIKGGQNRTTVRGNVIHDISARSIGGNMNIATNTEVLFNLVYNASSNAMEVNQDNVATTFYAYRNTFLGSVIVLNSTASTGPFYFSNNVIVNSSTGTDHITCGGGVVGCTTPSKVISSNNLSGLLSSGIVDARGNLTSAYLSYLGSRGYQINGNMPSPPMALTIQ